MPFAAILIGAILVVVAFNGTHAELGKALMTDAPGYFKWGLAIAIILGLGYIPGLRSPSRWLLALVAVVLLLTKGSDILAGFTSFQAAGPTPTGAEAAGTGSSTPGNTGTIANVASQAASTTSSLASAATSLSSLEHSIGFGGVA